MFPEEKSDLYEDVEIELSEKEKERIKGQEELDRYNAKRKAEREKNFRKN
jgi:hypothetical protein